MKFEQPDPSKLRNATLVVGVTLLAISAAQIEINTSEPISFVGLPLNIADRNFLTYTLMALSSYYLFRYWFYAMRRNSTWAVRKDLRALLEPSEDEENIHIMTLATEDAVTDWSECMVHSALPSDESSSFLNTSDSSEGQVHWEIHVKNLRKYSAGAFLRDLDFLTPVLVTLAALGMAVRNIVA